MASMQTPHFDLHSTPSPLSSEQSPTELNQSYIQSASTALQHPNDYMSTSTHSYLSPQDAGLGIRTDENEFSQYEIYGPESSELSYYDKEQAAGRGNCPSKLASPFDEHFYTSAAGWHNSDGLMVLSNAAPTPYSSTQDIFFHSHPTDMGSVQYMTPRPNPSMTPSHCLSTPHSQFKRPMIRHNSSSIVPQTTSSSQFQGLASTDAAPCQWTTQSEAPMWYDAVSPMEDTCGLQSNMIDYVGYNIDQNSQSIQSRYKARPAMTIPTRKKPHLRPSFSESCVSRSASPARMRAMSIGQHLVPSSDGRYMNNLPVQQLPLPPVPPSMLIKTPHMQGQPPMFTPAPTPGYRKPRSLSNTPQRWRRPSSPPPSDLNNPNTPFLAPVRQDPTFPGDLYTPRYKRRTSTGRWEGWCGYCQPGRWLDLKNSRFWEDKLRNHGICAKTKMRFAEPEQIRWVAIDGTVCQSIGPGFEVGDTGTDSKKREGLCGVCKTWVAMDGMRTKAKDRAVGWWMHAYKCHDHDQVAEQNIKLEQ